MKSKSVINAFLRVFKDDYKYKEYENGPFIDSLAYVVSETLYTERVKYDSFDCNMSDVIRLSDFMSIVVFFISAAREDVGRATMKNYIRSLRQEKIGQRYDKNIIEYSDDFKGVFVYQASAELVFSLLWTAYLYCYAIFLLDKAEGKDNGWKEAVKKLYTLMREEYPFKEEYLKECSPLQLTDEATKMMLEHIKKSIKNEDSATEQQVKENPDLTELQSRIKELEAENERLRNSLKAPKENDDSVVKQQLGKTQSALQDLQEEFDEYRNREGSPLTTREAVLLTFTAFANSGQMPKNRENLYPIIMKISGCSDKHARKILREKVKQEDCNRLALAFETIAPKTKRLIEELPQKMELLKLVK